MEKEYLELVETPSDEFNRFEKVIAASQRAKAFYELDDAGRSALGHKPSYYSLLEINEGKVKVIRGTVEPTE